MMVRIAIWITLLAMLSCLQTIIELLKVVLRTI